jgi:hypothetical protein
MTVSVAVAAQFIGTTDPCLNTTVISCSHRPPAALICHRQSGCDCASEGIVTPDMDCESRLDRHHGIRCSQSVSCSSADIVALDVVGLLQNSAVPVFDATVPNTVAPVQVGLEHTDILAHISKRVLAHVVPC